MPTFLFHEIVFGPVHSRRLGVSLGINLLPINGKVCSFDCLYCECGLNKDNKKDNKLPTRAAVKEALENKLQQMKDNGEAPDVITFAGNGEPTMHPVFSEIIDDTLVLRDAFFPKAQVCVLSNATQLHKPTVLEALRRIDQPILKLDSAFDSTIKHMDRPVSSSFTVAKLVEQLSVFGNKLIIQTLFTKGAYEGVAFDNTTEEELSAWINLLKIIAPASVMIYTIDRDTPIANLVKIPLETLEAIAERVQRETELSVSVAG